MEAKRDQNKVPTIQAALNTDGKTPQNIKANPVKNSLKVDDDTTGTDRGTQEAQRDANRVPNLLAVSSADGETPVALYVNGNGELLVDSS